MKKLILACIFSLTLLTISPGGALADTIPTHGAVVHLDPWPACALGDPGCGLFVPGFSNAPVGAGTPFQPGADDALDSINSWHVEDEILFADGPFSGMFLYVHGHFADSAGLLVLPGPFGVCGGGLELGPVCRTLVNRTPWDVWWGTSVTEDPFQFRLNIAPPGQFGAMLDWRQGDPPTLTQIEVPEPATLILLGFGMAGLMLARRFRKA